eukprot:TRINITY_DN1871_c1_g1_i1.p1 TRINITY_DN1871_c1_g1~~TRINITY_DN1871_c1_g1_i1.p1  ORF type:complete len:1509 (+),score=390.96 TRINITY_DN1871_c1_g1_i1:92-4618(+)
MRLYVGVRDGSRGDGSVQEAEWEPANGKGDYAGLLRTVTKCAGYADPSPAAVLYYVDLSDADEIVVRTDDDVTEFVDHHTAAKCPLTIHLRTAAVARRARAAAAAAAQQERDQLQQQQQPQPQQPPQPARRQERPPPLDGAAGPPGAAPAAGSAAAAPGQHGPPAAAGGLLSPVAARRLCPLDAAGFANIQWSRGHLLGAGATGKVFRAFDNDSGDFLAVKEVLLHGNEDNLRAVKREIELMRPLQHANIVRYKGIQQTTTALHILMEYVPGGSISSLLGKLGRFSEHVIRQFTRQVCQGLAYLHEHRIIHRDIKGGNCLVGVDGTVKLADFGCSVRVLATDGGGMPKPSRSVDSRHLGTSLWMSPEAVRDPARVTFATDIWSVGCTVVEMATARSPWADAHFTNEWAAMFYISQTQCGPPAPLHLSRQAHRLLGDCFAINPEDRPTVDNLLEHEFTSTPFEDRSDDPGMQPPSPSELAPAPRFPGARPGSSSPRGAGGGGAGSSDAHSCGMTATLARGEDDVSSVASFAPMDLRDQQWRHLDEEDTMLCAHEDDFEDVPEDEDAEGDDILEAPGSADSGSTGEDTPAPSSAEGPAAQQPAGPPQSSGESTDPFPPAGDNVAAGGAELTEGATGADGAAAGVSAAARQMSPTPPTGAPIFPPAVSTRTPALADLLPQVAGASPESARSVGAGPGALPRLPRPGGAVAPAAPDPAQEAEEPNAPQKAHVVASATAITQYLLIEQEHEHHRPTLEREYAALGLPDGVVYNVFFFLDAQALCAVSQCSRGLHKIEQGRSELVWRRLFLSEFGAVPTIQAALRRDWKQHYALSRRWAGQAVGTGGRYVIRYMLTPKVAEGVDTLNDDAKVIIKLEAPRRIRAGGGHAAVRSPAGTHWFGHSGPTPKKAARSGCGSLPSTTPTKGRANKCARPGSGPRPAGVQGSAVPRAQWSPMKCFQRHLVAASAAALAAAVEELGQQSEAGAPRPSSGPQQAQPGPHQPPPPPASAPAALRAAGAAAPRGATPRSAAGAASQRPACAPTAPPARPLPPPGPPPGPQQQQLQSPQQAPQPALALLPPPGTQPLAPPRADGCKTASALVPASPPLPLPLPTSRSPSKRQWQRRTVSSPARSSPQCPPALRQRDTLAQARAAYLTPLCGTVQRPFAAASADDASSAATIGGGYCGAAPLMVAALGVERHRLGSAGLGSSLDATMLSERSQWDAYEYVSEHEKFEQRRKDERQLQCSPLVLYHKTAKELENAGVPGVLRNLWLGQTTADGPAQRRQRKEAYGALVMQPGGPSLNDLLLFSGNRFKCKTVCMLALKVLGTLREVHERGIVHCNVCPSNLLVGDETSPSRVCLINWSFARPWSDRKSRRYVGSSARPSVRVRGSEHVLFSSPTVQMECTPSPRDDLISLAYCLFYFLQGGLPWFPAQCGRLTTREMIAAKKRLLEDKKDVRPVQLHHFLDIATRMRAHDMPDYPYLENVFRRMMGERGYAEDDDFEWSNVLSLQIQ